MSVIMHKGEKEEREHMLKVKLRKKQKTRELLPLRTAESSNNTTNLSKRWGNKEEQKSICGK